MAQKLLHQMVGPSLEAKNLDGSTRLLNAAIQGREVMVAVLLINGAQANSKDEAGKTPLMHASQRGHVGVVKHLVQRMKGQGLEVKDRSGRTALYYAVDGGHEEALDILLSHGARTDYRYSPRRTPLIKASGDGQLGVVKVLLKHGGAERLDARDGQGATALHAAVAGGHEEVVDLLLKYGARTTIQDACGNTPLMYAALGGHMGVVQKLLHVVGDKGLAERGEEGRTALHHAVIGGHDELVAFLMSKGAHVSSKDVAGVTPLMYASSRGHLDVVLRLVEVVGDEGLADTDLDGWTALHYAAHEGQQEVVDILLRSGAQASSQDHTGVTPLMQASWQGYLGVVQRLQQVVGTKGLQDRDVDGWTALQYAAEGGHEEVVTFLLSMGARATIKDSSGKSPLMHASWRGHLAVVRKLLEVVGAEGLAETDRGMCTALHYAVDRRHESVVALLLSHGSPANSKDAKGTTPLMHASVKGHLGVVRTLLQFVKAQGVEEADAGGRTALLHAVIEGHENVVTFLLKSGAQANSKDQAGLTPLLHALSRGHLGVVRKLLQFVRGQGLDERMADGRTALHMACSEGLPKDIVRMLLLAGADTTLINHGGSTARALAQVKGHSELVAMFNVSGQFISLMGTFKGKGHEVPKGSV